MSFADSDPNFTAATTTYEALFEKYFPTGQAPAALEQIATVVNVSSLELEIEQTTGNPQLREWLGAKRFKDFRTFLQRIFVKEYEASTEISRLKLKADTTGMLQRRLDTWTGGKAGGIANTAFSGLLANPVGWDGVSLIHDTHPYSSSTGDNKLTDQLSHVSYNLALEQMAGFKDEDGQSYNSNGDLLVVGPSLRQEALEITGATRPLFFNASGAEATSSVIGGIVVENVNKGATDVLVVPQFTGTQWLVVDRTKGRPIVIAMFEDLHPTTQTDDGSPARFLYNKLRFSIEGAFGFGAGLWFGVIGKLTA